MSDGSERHDPPTFHANIVTSNLNVDEMTMELRWYTRPHSGVIKAGAGPVPIPAATAEEVMAVEPVAKVSLTFSAVKALKEYLDQAFPEIEKNRKS